MATTTAASFTVGSVVVNFGQTAKVVGLWASASGFPSDQDGWLILKALGANGKPRGGKWVADPSKCSAAPVAVDYASSETAYGRTVPASFAIKVF